MGYIIKNTSGLVNTRITDTGRQKLSQGNFKIAYFQVGDSEVSYDKLPSSYNQANSYVLEPQFNAQNSAGAPQSNKQYVKYPYLVDQGETNTYGIPYMDSSIESVYNRAAMRGFFDGITTGSTISWRVLTGDYYVVTANYEVPMNQFVGDNKITLEYSACNSQNTRKPSVGDFVTIYYDGNGCSNCYCENLPTPTPTPTPSISPNLPLVSPTPTPTPSQYCCNSGTHPLPLNGQTVNIDGVDITAQSTGSVLSIGPQQLCPACYDDCIDITDMIYAGSDGAAWTYIMNFSQPVNNVQLRILNYSYTADTFGTLVDYESITFTVDNGDPTLTTCNACCYKILTNNLSAFNDNGCGLEFGSGSGIFNITSTAFFTTLTLTGVPYPAGLQFDLCGFDTLSSQLQSTNITSLNTQSTTPTPTPSSTNDIINCASPTPTPTPTHTPCLSPTPIPVCPPTPLPECYMNFNSCYLILTYRIIEVCENLITLDRNTPDYCNISPDCCARVLVYPPNMTSQYDSYTPRPHWADNVIDFESICDIDQFNVKIWNMNIPWTENPAGLISTQYKGYTNFGSIDYIGSKEYFGYNSSRGQNTTDDVYYYNSFSEKIIVTPEEQKAIAIIHYTNQTIDFFYGEKFALEPYDPTNPLDTTGQARNFKLHIPTLMWHKNRECCFGVTFWVDPPGFEDKDLFQVQYITSTKNSDMNQPGLRYYNLWDTYANSNGLPSRVGKVFPDSHIVIIDDEEIVAALSYKSNRNFTLPAPQVSLITPNVCDSTNTSEGILTGNGETMYITYQLENDYCFTNWLHSNYYSKIVGNDNQCNPDVSKNVAVRFGPEFPCLNQPGFVPTTTTTTTPTTTTTTTLNPPCWENGFQMNLVVGSNVVNLDFQNSGTFLNGQPVFVGLYETYPLNIYWNGTEWVVIAVDNVAVETVLFTTEDPIGYFDTSLTPGSVITISGNTYCGDNTQICFTICPILGSCDDVIFYQTISANTTVYVSQISNSVVSYDILSGDWVMDINGTIEATLPGLTANDEPLGSWITSSQYYSIDSFLGQCNVKCNCINFSATTISSVSYVQCNGVLAQAQLQQYESIDACVLLNVYNLDSGSVVISNCTIDCTQLQTQLQTQTQTSSVSNSQNSVSQTNFSNLLATTTTFCPVCNIETGFWATNFKILAQKVASGERPNPEKWRIIDFTSQIDSKFINGYVTEESLTGSTFIITPDNYNSAPYYKLNNYIDLVPVSQTGPSLNFGDEYYFYGNIETDIQATIYEMKYKINLGQDEFFISQNPSWTQGKPPYITEIGLFDENKDLLVISKLQSPTLRQGIQQYVVKLDL